MTTRRSWLDRATSWSPLLLLGSFAALTYWLDTQIQQAQTRGEGVTRHDPDLYIERFSAFNLDATGTVRQALLAQRGVHFPDDDSSEFDSPEVTFTTPGSPTLNVTAAKGKITGDREHAYFRGHVKAVREAVGEGQNIQGPITLTTEYLHVLPRKNRAETDQAVTITEPRGIIQSVGMILDNEKKTVKMQSKVQGQFQPQQQ